MNRIPPVLKLVLRAALVFLAWSVLVSPFALLPGVWALVWVILSVAALSWWYLVRPRIRGDRRLRAALRLRPIPPALWGWLAAAALVLFVMNSSVVRLWASLGIRPPRAGGELFARVAEGAFGWGTLALFTVAFAPLLEEVVFRGRLQYGLERQLGPRAAIVLAALLFAVAHGEWMGVPNRLMLGLFVGWTVYRTRSLWSGIALHVGNNALATALALSGGSVSGGAASTAGLVGSVALFLVSVGALVWLAGRIRTRAMARAGEAEHEIRMNRTATPSPDGQLREG